MVCGSDDGERLLPLRSDELPRSTAFLRRVPFADAFWPGGLGAATAGVDCEHSGGVGDAAFPGVFWSGRLAPCGFGDGGLAGLCFLRALFDSRIMAGSFFDPAPPRRARHVANRNAASSVHLGYRCGGNDSHQGDLCPAHRLHGDRGRHALDLSNVGSFTPDVAGGAPAMDARRRGACQRGGRTGDCLFLLRHLPGLPPTERAL